MSGQNFDIRRNRHFLMIPEIMLDRDAFEIHNEAADDFEGGISIRN
jgi:hypothetical protein